MTDDEIRTTAIRIAPRLRASLGYIDIDRSNPDEDWADVVRAVLEEIHPPAGERA